MNPTSLLVVLLGLATAPVGTRTPEKGEEDVAKATAAFNRGHYVEAARAFDQLYTENESLALLHYAALAWAAAGDDTRAILRWRRLEADPASQGLPEAQDAGDFLAEAYKRTTAVGISLTPGSIASEVTALSLKRLDKGEQQAISIVLTGAAVDERDRHVVFLAPGRWSLTADVAHPGYAPAQIVVDISAHQAELETTLLFHPLMGELAVKIEGLAEGETAELVLKDEAGIGEPIRIPLPSPDGVAHVRAGAWTYEASSPRGEQLTGRVDVAPGAMTTLPLAFNAADTHQQPTDETPSRRLKLDLGLGLGALVVGGVGVGTFVTGYQVLGPGGLNSVDGCTGETKDLRRECAVGPASTRSSAGVSLMGSSLGLATNALLVRTKLPRQLYWVPWTSGLVLTTGGIAWLQTAHSGFLKSSFLQSDGTTPDDDLTVSQAEINRHYWRREVPAAMLMGIGTGLLAGASLALLTQHIKGKPRAARERLSIVPGITGLSLAGKF